MNEMFNIELTGIQQEMSLDILLNESNRLNNIIKGIDESVIQEGIGDLLKSFKDKVVKFFKWLWNKVKEFFGAIKKFILGIFNKEEILIDFDESDFDNFEDLDFNESVDIINEGVNEDKKKFIKVLRAYNKLINKYHAPVYSSNLFWFPNLLNELKSVFSKVSNNGLNLMPKIYKAIGSGENRVDRVSLEDLKNDCFPYLTVGAKFYGDTLGKITNSNETSMYLNMTTKEFELKNAVALSSKNISKYGNEIIQFYYDSNDVIKMINDMQDTIEKCLKKYESNMLSSYDPENNKLSPSEMVAKSSSFVSLFVNQFNGITKDCIKCCNYQKNLAKRIIRDFTSQVKHQIKEVMKEERE